MMYRSWELDRPWGYGAFGIPYGKKIEDCLDFRARAVLFVGQVEKFALLKMTLVELNIAFAIYSFRQQVQGRLWDTLEQICLEGKRLEKNGHLLCLVSQVMYS